ncbi:expressed unknown protein [Seminavis robusta]|uniref:Uncharacterized protein n=1 Tax=Seminavis robusta TaxID=568900 RepID=A0A9N8DEQ4_9STRA|nr:expressed unknown protein [Seminavis robusta]|eukprot:Sro105_g053260.1 n/a (3582) ;mRNA; r:68273-79018
MRKQQPPTPARRHKKQQRDSELTPSSLFGGGKLQRRSNKHRPMDPEGDNNSRHSGSDPEGSIHSDEQRNDTSGSSSTDWVSESSGIEESSREPAERSPLPHLLQRPRSSPKHQQRGYGRSPSVKTAVSEYDNVIISRRQQQQQQQQQQLRQSPSKSRKNTYYRPSAPTPRDEASMASSIDDSSGILDLDLDFDPLTPRNSRSISSNNTNNNKKKGSMSTAAGALKYRVHKKAAKPKLPVPEEDSAEQSSSTMNPSGSERVGRRDQPASPAHRRTRSRSNSQRAYLQHRAKAFSAPDASENRSSSSGTGESSVATGPLPPTPTARYNKRIAAPPPAKNLSRQEPSSSAVSTSDDVSAAASSVTGSSGAHLNNVKPLRWTEQETDNLLMQLEFFGDGSLQQQRLPKRSVQKVVSSIQAVVEKDGLRRDDPILQNLTKTLHSIRMVDLDKLLRLLHENHKIGNLIEGKSVVLLCGPTGAGKTTTLHYLGGTTLEEVDEQGFFHLKPISFGDPQLKDYETSCCRKHMTRTLQGTTVKVQMGRDDASSAVDEQEEEIVVCDTPGLGHVDSVEEEISNGLGMINELQRAKSIHPVLVLSRETLGSRFGNLMEIIHAMRDQFVLESKVDLVALNYIFTKYEGKHRTRICKQVSVLENIPADVPEEDRVIYKAFVKDIIKKTTPKANLALPMEDDPKRCLQDLWDHAWSRDGKDLMVPFASKSATQKLKLQLQLTVYDFANLLAKGDYPLALHRLHQLRDLGMILPDAVDSADKARRVGIRHVTVVSDLIKEMVEEHDFVSAAFQLNELSKLEKHIPEVTPLKERTIKKLRKRLKVMVEEGSVPIVAVLNRLENMRKLATQLDLAKELVQVGFDSILKRVLRTMEERDIDATIFQLEELSKVAHRIPEAGECAWHALKVLKDVVTTYSESHDFEELFHLMQKLSKMAPVFSDARECIQIGFDSLRKKAARLFEDKNYGRFITQIRHLSELAPHLPASHPFANRGAALLQETTMEIVSGKDFSAAVEVMLKLQNLQELFPDATEIVRLGFESLLTQAVATVNTEQCDQTADKLMKLGQLLPGLPFSGDIVKRGLKPFHKSFLRTVQSLRVGEAIMLLEDLHSVTPVYPEIKDSIETSVENLLQDTTRLIGEKDFPTALDQLSLISKLVRKFSLPSQIVQRGISDLPDRVQQVLETADFESGLDLLQRLGKLIDLHADIGRCTSEGFEKLIQKAAQLMTVHDYTESLAQLEALGAIKHKFPLAEGCVQRGLTEFSLTLNKFLQFMDFIKAVDVLHHLHKVARAFPEAFQCVRLGYELLLEKAIDVYEHRCYSQALKEMIQLGQLYQQFSLPQECNRGNIKYLATIVPGSLNDASFDDGLDILREFTSLLRLMPEIIECIHAGYETLLKKASSEISADNFQKPLEVLKTVAAIIEPVPDTEASRSRGLHNLLDTVSGVIQELDFESSRDLLKDFHGMKHQYPEAAVLVQLGFNQLTEKAAINFATNDCYRGINQMQQLGQLKQVLQLDDRSVRESKSTEMLKLKVIDTIKNLEFELAAEVIERIHKMSHMFPTAEEMVVAGYRQLSARTAMSFEKNSYHEGIKQLHQLGQLRQVLALEESVSKDSKGNELLKLKVLDTMKDLKFDTAIELVGRVNKGVHVYPETEEIVVAGYKQLLSRTAMSFEKDGYHQGIGHLQSLGRLRQLLEMDDRSVHDSRGNHILQGSVLGAMKPLEFEAAVELLGMINELVHIFPEVSQTIEAGFGELLEKTAATFSESGYGQGISQLHQLGQLKQHLEVDDSSLKESRRAVLQSLVGSVKKNVEQLQFSTALKFTQDLNDLAKSYPEASEGVDAAFECLLQRAVCSFEQVKCSEGAARLERLAQARRTLGMDGKHQKGLENLVAAAQRIFDSSDLNEIIELMGRLSKLVDDFPEAREFVNVGVQRMWQGFEAAADERAFKAAIGMLQEIGSFSTVSPLAERYFTKGKKHMKRIADSTMDGDDFMIGVELSKMLVKIDNDVAEADETFRKGGDRLRDQMEQRIRTHDYDGAADAMQKLCVEMSKNLPQAIEYARSGLRLTEQQMENAAATRDTALIFSVLKDFAKLETVLPEASQCLQRALQLLRQTLEKSVERNDFSDTLLQIETLHAKSQSLLRLHDVVQYGVILLGKAIEKPIHHDKQDAMAELVRKLNNASIPRGNECARRGLKGFWKTTKQSIEDQDYGTAISLMRHMRRLAAEIPEAGDCVQLAFVALRVRLVKAIDKQRYETAIVLLQQLSTLAEELPEAFECAQFGFEALQERLEKTIEEKNYSKVVEQMRNLSSVTENLPEVTELFIVGLSALSDALSRLVDRSDFTDALSLMEELAGLAKERPETMDCIRQGLFKFWALFEDRISAKKYSEAVGILQYLGSLAHALSEAEDGVQLGFEVLEEKFEKMIEDRDYDSAVLLMQDLSKLAYELPEASSCIQNGFELLRERLVKIIEQQDFNTARSLIGKLERKLPSPPLPNPTYCMPGSNSRLGAPEPMNHGNNLSPFAPVNTPRSPPESVASGARRFNGHQERIRPPSADPSTDGSGKVRLLHRRAANAGAVAVDERDQSRSLSEDRSMDGKEKIELFHSSLHNGPRTNAYDQDSKSSSGPSTSSSSRQSSKAGSKSSTSRSSSRPSSSGPESRPARPESRARSRPESRPRSRPASRLASRQESKPNSRPGSVELPILVDDDTASQIKRDSPRPTDAVVTVETNTSAESRRSDEFAKKPDPSAIVLDDGIETVQSRHIADDVKVYRTSASSPRPNPPAYSLENKTMESRHITEIGKDHRESPTTADVSVDGNETITSKGVSSHHAKGYWASQMPKSRGSTPDRSDTVESKRIHITKGSRKSQMSKSPGVSLDGTETVAKQIIARMTSHRESPIPESLGTSLLSAETSIDDGIETVESRPTTTIRPRAYELSPLSADDGSNHLRHVYGKTTMSTERSVEEAMRIKIKKVKTRSRSAERTAEESDCSLYGPRQQVIASMDESEVQVLDVGGREKDDLSADLTELENEKVEILHSRLLSTIEDEEFGAFLDVLITLSTMEMSSPAATDTLEAGYRMLRDKVQSSIADMKCSIVLDMMRTFNLQLHKLTLIKECTFFGLKELEEAVEKRVEKRQYSNVIDLLQLFGKLSIEIDEAATYTQGALTSTVQHMVMLREETATSFEDLAEVQDMTLLAKLLETTCESLEMVMATEQLRSFCSQWEKTQGSEAETAGIVCTVRLATSETYCAEQVRKLSDKIVSEFPTLMVDADSIEELTREKQEEMMFILERLLLLRRVLRGCPGAGVLNAAFVENFEKLHSFIDGVVSLAQTEFMPQMNLKDFENHVVLVKSMIKRLSKLKTTLHSDERKKVEDLEHRCTRLLLRFEIEIADAVEVLGNYNFPLFQKDDRKKMSSYIRTMRVSQVHKHREVLLSCVNSRELTELVSKNVDIYRAERTLTSFDKTLEKFLDNLILQLEEEKASLDAKPKTKSGLPTSREQIEALCKDVPKVVEEVTTISQWPTEYYSMDSPQFLNRLKVLEDTVNDLTRKAEEMNNIGFSAFINTFTNSVSDYYNCMNNISGPSV